MKQKTHSGAKKRVKVKGKGKKLKLTFNKAGRRHLLLNKSKKQKAIKNIDVHETNTNVVKKLLNL